MAIYQPVTNLETNVNGILIPHVSNAVAHGGGSYPPDYAVNTDTRIINAVANTVHYDHADNATLHGSALSGYAVNTDTRLTDAREPTAHNSSFHSITYAVNTVFATHADNTTLHGSAISGYAVNTDTRLTDAREPTAHNSSFHSVVYATNTIHYGHEDNATPHTVLTGYAVNTDARFTDAREPTAHNSSFHTVTYPTNTVFYNHVDNATPHTVLTGYGVNTDLRLIQRVWEIKLIDDATALTTGDRKFVFMIPPPYNAWTIVAINAFVSVNSTSGLPSYQLRNITQANVNILSTIVSIDANESDSLTAATPPVINTNFSTIISGNKIGVSKDVAGTGEKGDGILITVQSP